MRWRVRTTLTVVFVSVVLFALVSLNRFRNAVANNRPRITPVTLSGRSNNPHIINYAIQEEPGYHARHVYSIQDSITTEAVLLPDWEVLVVVSPDASEWSACSDEYTCVFQNNDTSPARSAGVLPSTNRTTFLCLLPNRMRRLRPFFKPILTRSPAKLTDWQTTEQELIRWNSLVYESFSTENDVVLFAKGVNNRQRSSRPPSELRCVFSDNVNFAVETAVVSSAQEVFRCRLPEKSALPIGGEMPIKISIKISDQNHVLPSIAHYTPWRRVAFPEEKAQLCACTMVHNVAKFLKEWVMYHSSIGVSKFILYDNGSDDDMQQVIEELAERDFDVETLAWRWPKTQEAGFSHCAIYARDFCTWMTFVDVDEFVFSPSWLSSPNPSKLMLKNLLPNNSGNIPVGQISINCNEFGPSNQRSHPINGVTQGYTCRRRVEQRHKSAVLLDAIDDSLLNVIHHFELKKCYRTTRLRMSEAAVNHYKYQAWSEFKAKFRRRVSAYVVDWTSSVNPKSKDRTPGLGFEPIEPIGWAGKFCEVRDSRLQRLTERWFGRSTQSEHHMAWL